MTAENSGLENAASFGQSRYRDGVCRDDLPESMLDTPIMVSCCEDHVYGFGIWEHFLGATPQRVVAGTTLRVWDGLGEG